MKKEEFGVLIDGLTASQITHTKRSHRHLGLAWLVRLSRRLRLGLFPIPEISRQTLSNTRHPESILMEGEPK